MPRIITTLKNGKSELYKAKAIQSSIEKQEEIKRAKERADKLNQERIKATYEKSVNDKKVIYQNARHISSAVSTTAKTTPKTEKLNIDDNNVSISELTNKSGESGHKYPLTTGTQSGIFSDNIAGASDMGPWFWASNIYNRADIAWYDKFNRFGVLDPYNALTNTREYLFFTKPDLHICTPGTTNLNPQLANSDFFVELAQRYPQVVLQLQKSIYPPKHEKHNPFMPILTNAVKNKLDMPEMAANVIDTGATIFGTSINYRGDAFNSGEKHDFSLEFEDTRYLEIYHLFRAMEEYAQLKKHGVVSPPCTGADNGKYVFTEYHKEKILHDQFAIYKFIVDEDYQDIVYYALLAGVFTKSTPREAFSDIDPNGGLRYNVQFEAQFVDDMKPWILTQFNNLIYNSMPLGKDPEWLEVYNTDIGEIDGRWAKTPYVVRQMKSDTNIDSWLAPTSMKYKYQLKWRLS